MFGFLLKTTTYYVLWKKFNKQIILLILSLLAILLINAIYEDLFTLLKVSHKESLIGLFIIKWFFILLIALYNIYKLKNVKLTAEERAVILETNEPELPKQIQELLKKKKLTSTTDLILKKYKK